MPFGIYGSAEYAKYDNERKVFSAIERGTYPKLPVNLVTRTLITDNLKKIFFRPYDYHLVVGEHGTGKTTTVIQAATECGGGIVYIGGSDQLRKFNDSFAKALGWSPEIDESSGMLMVLGLSKSDSKGYRIWILLK